MSIHAYPELPPGVDINTFIESQEAGEDTVESQDNPSPEDWCSMRGDRRAAEAVYFRTLRREGLKHKRKYSLGR